MFGMSPGTAVQLVKGPGCIYTFTGFPRTPPQHYQQMQIFIGIVCISLSLMGNTYLPKSCCLTLKKGHVLKKIAESEKVKVLQDFSYLLI